MAITIPTRKSKYLELNYPVMGFIHDKLHQRHAKFDEKAFDVAMMCSATANYLAHLNWIDDKEILNTNKSL